MQEFQASSRGFAHARSLARRLVMQALYEYQLNTQPWQDLHNQYAAREDFARADRGYFQELLQQISSTQAELDAQLAPLLDRPPENLDPLEHAILLIGLYELKTRLDVPYRVAISEGVDLAKRFGATDGHKFVNAVLDRAAIQLRPSERRG